jgi:hypothetical protein
MAENKGYMVDVEGKRCVTPELRGGYVNLIETQKFEDKDTGKVTESYGMQGMLEKSETVTAFLKEVNILMGKVLVSKLGREKAVKYGPIIRSPFRDGDDPAQVAALKNSDQLAGMIFFNTKNIFKRPILSGPDGRPIPEHMLSANDFYSGAYYRLLLSFGYYDKKGNKGISAYLDGVMKTRDGERLDSVVTEEQAVDAFSSFADPDAAVNMAFGDAMGVENSVQTETVEVGGGTKTEASKDLEDSGQGFNFM